ncbi:hypothetical protein L484_021507 [Morus notabilis]|uniref:DNA/pantothenate metabolism flavoprotein C-terminal domain-containing protein n=1 Tax=Morus notabilis TaxID=981085 RepID=W9RSQ2_9ROSA|nr:hypothetical protein L484_021507 [Morus notabilis]
MKIDGECLIELIGSCRNKVQVYRSVRMPQLHASLHFHLTPIVMINGLSRRDLLDIVMLRMIAIPMSNLGPNAIFYLAAAVSDFYVPWQSMAEHKIQSASGPLNMQLAQVPKMLSVLRRDWAPMAFCISFKLETDSKILLEKAGVALKKYKMNMVVANELSSRKEEVVIVTSDGQIPVRRNKAAGVDDVENPLIQLIVERHSAHIESSNL